MIKLYLKEKIFSAAEKFTVANQAGQPVYYVEGSLFNAPKSFVLKDSNQQPLAKITKKILAFLPKFVVEVPDEPKIEIKKEFSLLKPSYSITPQNFQVQGDLFSMNFSVTENKNKIAQIHKKALSWGDTYEITILEQEKELLIVALVVTIDYALAENTTQL